MNTNTATKATAAPTVYNEHALTNETKFKMRADGGQMFSHHVMTIHQKPLLTNIKIEPHRAAALNNQAHNRQRIYLPQGAPVPQTIVRSKELTDGGFETGKWKDKATVAQHQ
jgi:hypothetical protein